MMTTNADLIKKCITTMDANECGSDAYTVAAWAMARAVGPATDTLHALIRRGPLWDGDVPSKQQRDDLIAWGLAVRVVVKGEQGFTAATYRGWWVHRAASEGDSHE